VQKFAAAYAKTVFLKFYGNHSEGTKHLFETRLQTPMTPAFTFWRQGERKMAFQSLHAVSGHVHGAYDYGLLRQHARPSQNDLPSKE